MGSHCICLQAACNAGVAFCMGAAEYGLTRYCALRFLDPLQAAHVGHERVRDGDAAILLLVVLQDGDQRAADGEAGAVEGMDEAVVLAALGAVARVHAPRLEVAANGTGGDLAVGVLPRQPHLDVVGLARRKPHVARAQHHGAVGETEPLQHLLGAVGHALVLRRTLLRRRYGHQLHLGELVLPDHPARILARRPGLGAEAGRIRRDPDRQLRLVADRLAHQVGEWNLGGGDEPIVFLERCALDRAVDKAFQVDLSTSEFIGVGFGCKFQCVMQELQTCDRARGKKLIVGELRQLRRAVHHVVAHEVGRHDLGVAAQPVLLGGSVQVEHELGQRALQPRQLPPQHHEAGAGKLGRGLEVHQAQGLADLEVLPRLVGPGELGRGADLAHLLVALLVGADGHIVGRQVGDDRERLGERLVCRAPLVLALGQLVLERRHLGHQRAGLGLVLGGLGLADLLGGRVAARLRLLQPRHHPAPRLVERDQIARELDIPARRDARASSAPHRRPPDYP